MAPTISNLPTQKLAACFFFGQEFHLIFRALNALTHSHLTIED